MQIGHANIHTCSRSTVCDIFRTGSNRKIADQETSNFTSAGTASFRQKITYSSAGERNVFAHIILPPKDYLEESYHFITFITTNVEASSTSAADEESSGLYGCNGRPRRWRSRDRGSRDHLGGVLPPQTPPR